MRIVVALGGNALLRRGEPLTAENQLNNIKHAAQQIAKLAPNNQLIITHGNGPQVGLLALQNAAYHPIKPYPLDVLNAESEGMIGYLLEQEIANHLSHSRTIATLLTRVEVDSNDPAFTNPTKPIGPIYSKEEAEQVSKNKSWVIVPEEGGYRRVVASPKPKRILGVDSIHRLLRYNAIVIACGGGGIPVIAINDSKAYKGVESVIDKDFCSALLAKEIAADYFLIATDVDAVYIDWGKSTQRPIREISFTELDSMDFAAGTMGPKVKAACQFVKITKHPAAIGSLEHISDILNGFCGTQIRYKEF